MRLRLVAGFRAGSRLGSDRGSASIEMAVLTPAVIAILVMLLIAGRTGTAKQALEAAAFDAARTASLARTPDEARGRALAEARDTLAAQRLECDRLTVDVDVSGFAVPVGQPATVSASVTCRVRYSDIALPGMPGGVDLSTSFVSPLDRYRSRQ